MAPQQPDRQKRPTEPYEPAGLEERTALYVPSEPYEPYEPYDGEHDGGATRAAVRSAERAAALAATEGFHPLRIRPYVAEPGADGDQAADGTDPYAGAGAAALAPAFAAAGPAPGDLGLFAERYAGLEYPQGYLDDEIDGGVHGLNGVDGLDGVDGVDAAEIARQGRHRRRRRGIAVAAAAVAASALAAGAVAMTGQVMSDEQGGAGRSLPDLGGASMPDVTLPADSEPATATAAASPVTQRAAPEVPALATTPPDPASASPAAAAAVVAAAASVTASGPSVTIPATGTGVTPPVTTPVTTPPAGTPPPTATTPPVTALPVLRLGDTGAAVADLQRRLTEMWIYHGPIDGVFDHDVQWAVATFQVWYWVSDSPQGVHDGVYGPRTRATLERQTAG